MSGACNYQIQLSVPSPSELSGIGEVHLRVAVQLRVVFMTLVPDLRIPSGIRDSNKSELSSLSSETIGKESGINISVLWVAKLNRKIKFGCEA